MWSFPEDPAGPGWSRRDWLRWSLGGMLVPLLLPACNRVSALAPPPGSAPASGGPAPKPAGNWVLLGFAPDPEHKGKSILSVAFFRRQIVKKLSLPMASAHYYVKSPRDPHVVWILGFENKEIYSVDLRSLEITGTASTVDGFVTSGHAATISHKGRNFVVTTEYRLGGGGEGSLFLRDPVTLAVVERISSFGRFPHVVFYRDVDRQLVVQNRGQRLEDEYFTDGVEIALVDAETLRPTKRVHPGKMGTKYEFEPGRLGLSREARRFRQVAEYQLDSKRLMFPHKRWITTELPEAGSVCIWDTEEGMKVREIHFQNVKPIHATADGEGTILVAGEGGGLYRVPALGVSGKWEAPPWMKSFLTDKHVSAVMDV